MFKINNWFNYNSIRWRWLTVDKYGWILFLSSPVWGVWGMNPSITLLYDIESVLKDTTPITPTKFFHHENVTVKAKNDVLNNKFCLKDWRHFTNRLKRTQNDEELITDWFSFIWVNVLERTKNLIICQLTKSPSESVRYSN